MHGQRRNGRGDSESKCVQNYRGLRKEYQDQSPRQTSCDTTGVPCPFFEPQRVISLVNATAGRRPLIDEYDGLCHAAGAPAPVPEAARFRLCNHGNSRSGCEIFPASETRSCLRYEVVERSETTLRVLCIEEQNYAPVRWYSIDYTCCDAHMEPDPPDFCVRAQLLAFCRSYLVRVCKAVQA